MFELVEIAGRDELTTLSDEEVMSGLVQASQAIARLQAWQSEVVNEVGVRVRRDVDAAAAAGGAWRPGDLEGLWADEVAGALGLTCGQAQWMVRHAHALAVLPGVQSAHRRGELDHRRAALIVELAEEFRVAAATAGLDVQVAEKLLEPLIEVGVTRAKAVDTSRLRRWWRRVASRELRRVVPEAALSRRERVVREARGVWLEPTGRGCDADRLGLLDGALTTGLVSLRVELPADDAARVYAVLDAVAQMGAGLGRGHTDGDENGDTRSRAARRADALVDLVTQESNGQSRVRTLVHLLVPAATVAAGMSGLTESVPVSSGTLSGVGQVSAGTARSMAYRADAVWQRLLCEPATGLVTGADRGRYRPPRWMRELVTARDVRCRFPGCIRSARAADLDHCVPFDQGGPTDPSNLHALCRTHHRRKSAGLVSCQPTETGELVWIGPLGRATLTAPEDHRDLVVGTVA